MLHFDHHFRGSITIRSTLFSLASNSSRLDVLGPCSPCSLQTNDCKFGSSCGNNVEDIVILSGNGHSSSSQNEQTNKCLLSSECVNNNTGGDNVQLNKCIKTQSVIIVALITKTCAWTERYATIVVLILKSFLQGIRVKIQALIPRLFVHMDALTRPSS